MIRKLFVFIPLVLFACKGFSQAADAQKAFLEELNNILAKSATIHFAYNDPMKIDSAFAIRNGSLSVTVRYQSQDSGFYRVRMEVPVADIEGAFQDIYLLLECKPRSVRLFESSYNSEQFKLIEKRDFFHVGLINDGGVSLERLEKRLKDLRTK